LNCPFCYRPKNQKGKPLKFFKDLIPYIAELSPQVAVGGGEPFLYPKFIKSFSKDCKKFNLLCNVTTNGTQPMPKDVIKNIEMISVSLDREKRPWSTDLIKFRNTILDLNKSVRTGCNYLLEKRDLEYPKEYLARLLWLYEGCKVERVFALYPKNWKFLDILKMKPIYYAPTFKWKHFYVDDLTNMILTENRYKNWKHPCHYGKDLISISEQGYVTGCSFDSKDKALLKLEKPEDLMNIRKIKVKERFSCPYLKM